MNYFRNRKTEWLLSGTMLLWGLFILLSCPVATLSHVGLMPIMSVTSWGVLALITGIIRLIFLTINGAWRPSAHIRLIGSVIGCAFWSAIIISADWLSPNIVLYASLLIMDMLSLWFIAEDAKLADIKG